MSYVSFESLSTMGRERRGKSGAKGHVIVKESSGEGGVYWKISGEGNHIVVWDHSRQGSPGHPDQLDQRGDKKERERDGR